MLDAGARRLLAAAAVALAVGLLVSDGPVLGKELDESAIAGEYLLHGEEDDDTPIDTTLTVTVTNHRFEVTRVTTLTGTGTTRTYRGTATRKKDKLEVVFALTVTPGFSGALDGTTAGGKPKKPITAEYSFKSKGRVKGDLDNDDRIDGWKDADESGTKKGLPDQDDDDDDGPDDGPATPGADAAEITRGPYVQNVAGTTATIVWRTKGATDSIVEYGSRAALGSRAGTATVKDRKHAVVLAGLAPGQPCFYRVVAAGQPTTAAVSFKTPAPAGSGFRFLAFGDSGSGSREQMDLAAKMTAESYDFAIHTGDVVYPNGEAKHYDKVYFAPYKALGASHCVFPSIGNHDAKNATSGYLDAFHLPANNPARDERYYSFDWGDAHLVSLDTSSGKLTGPAVDWLRSDLAQTTRPWTIVYLHIPLYSGGKHGSSSTLQKQLEPIFEQFRVPLVIQGHDHDYQRTIPIKGTTYVVTGGGGKDPRGVSKKSWTARCESVLHYTLVTVGPAAIAARAIALDGHEVDSFSLTR